jgi:hypothetical protein
MNIHPLQLCDVWYLGDTYIGDAPVVYFFNGPIYDAFSIAEYITSNYRMRDVLERIWKEAVVA